jgi:hypothetical protein
MANAFGLSPEGLQTALDIKKRYVMGEPVCVPGDDEQILLPEYLLNHDLDLSFLEDPIPLALLATRDPESPMSVAAVTRLSPLGRTSKLLSGVIRIVGETSKHPLVTECVSLVTENDFEPDSIARIRRHAGDFIVKSRQQYTAALRQNLQGLMDGEHSPRQFVHNFFELTEAGNLRTDIRKRLVLSLLLSENVRPSVKFLVLENFHRMPKTVRIAIISGVLQAEPSHHVDLVKEEIRWIVAHEGHDEGV